MISNNILRVSSSFTFCFVFFFTSTFSGLGPGENTPPWPGGHHAEWDADFSIWALVVPLWIFPKRISVVNIILNFFFLQKVCSTINSTTILKRYACETNINKLLQRKVRVNKLLWLCSSGIRGISLPHLPFAAGLSDHWPRCCRAFAPRLWSKLLQAAEAVGGQALFWCPKFNLSENVDSVDSVDLCRSL